MGLDIKDMKILSFLDKDCRLSSNKIAKKVVLSKEAVNYRIKQLEKNGVVEGYFAQINFFKLGYKLVRLYLKFQNISKEVFEKIVDFALKEKNLWTLYETDGRCDIAIGLLVSNLSEYLDFQNRLVEKFGEYVLLKDVSVFTGIAYFPRKYLDRSYENYDSYYIEDDSYVLDIDEIDKRILKLLTENAKMPLLDIGKEVGLSANGVKYKIKQMEKKKVIVAYRTQINFRKLGYFYYKVDLILNDSSIISSLRKYIKEDLNVVFEDICVGGSDFEFDCEFESDEKMQEMIDKLYEKFFGKIRSHFYYKAKKIYPYNYFFLK